MPSFSLPKGRTFRRDGKLDLDPPNGSPLSRNLLLDVTYLKAKHILLGNQISVRVYLLSFALIHTTDSPLLFCLLRMPAHRIL